jgi:hypothetical protein
MEEPNQDPELTLADFLSGVTMDALEDNQTRIQFTIHYKGNLVDCELCVKRIYVPGLSTTKQ